LPDAALPYVLEELENGRDAYLVAGAARALRGLDTPTSRVVPFLFKAVENIRHIDDALTFESYKPRWPIELYDRSHRDLSNIRMAWHSREVRPARPGSNAERET
jgi:protein SCO1